ncbi:hypothetical protein MNQ98_20255 [Paenibacillus sp. N3/727]|uniref:hypothetical protein n=1 Tax=Paenibacillus sp. N3/727 TaxID=2925845 RepID=UPI001F5336C0|nr:hypothetical protein [Paenibacillus sp. N3/727]UNK16814.1 hypothetical protein MNQ98_20255 [Paenibacillus sp. N3/727]
MMERIILSDLHMRRESLSYIDALYAILMHRGSVNCSKSVLSGMTAMAFRFTVNRRLSVDSATAYNWMAEHFVAADLLGLTTTQHAGFHFQPTFSLYQKAAVQDIKQSITRGTGALVWKDSFVVVTGYDDEQQTFFYCDGISDEYQTIRYEDFGCNHSPYWYYQLYEKQIAMDIDEIYKESLMQAVSKWETHDIMLPSSEYACGRQAYAAIIEALQSGYYDEEGALETFRCYGAAKQDIAQYMFSLKNMWPVYSNAAELYGNVAERFDDIVQKTPRAGTSLAGSRTRAKQLIPLFMEAQQREEEAVQELRLMLSENIHNRFEDIGLR